ncbi:MAG TPA: FKBP-type peptidyl-prolyl cis-trans isomerase [Chitinophagaceae bacterium]|nr:FKBP-type peptidyl-prolyl cis-trans isomerase [Chitinophagaceae bacterium]
MRKSVLLLVCAVVVLSGLRCFKSNNTAPCAPKPVADDEPAILAYLAANNITGYAKLPSGMYYKIDSMGSGASPNASSKVYVTYTGKFTDNSIFDSVSDASKTGWTLGTLIQGWQIGLPLISKGGRIKLFIPSALGYGCQATGPIPANSVLVFDIVLVDFS